MALTETYGTAYAISQEGRELVSHGTPLFPVAFYHDDLVLDRVPWHWHDEMEAVYIASGETVVETRNARYSLSAGQGFFINANVLHAAHGIPGSGCRYHSVVFHPRLIGGGIDSVYWQDYLRPLIGSGPKSLALDGSESWHQGALKQIERAWQAGALDAPGYEFQVRAALSELIFMLFRHIPQEPRKQTEKDRRDLERIRQMLLFIQQNYAEEITAADIAASAMISESECLRCFRATIGAPPMQYVKRYRVQKAAELLSSTDLRIAEIGDACGFQDTSYFTRAFRELKGITPGEYRRSVSNGPRSTAQG